MVLVLLGSLWLGGEAWGADPAPTGKVVKVLPFFLNLHGQASLSPSLFDRDAYQAYLRTHTNEISGVRYDVLWKASGTAASPVKIKVELQAVGTNGAPSLRTLEATVKPGHFRRWTELPLTGEDFVNLGHVVAWRATLWSGDQLLGAQQSFLW